MIGVDAKVDIDLTPLQKFEQRVDAELNGQRSGPVAKAVKQWGVRYRSWAQERFDKFSKGGGDWPPLKPSTIRGRRKGVKGRKIGSGKTAVAAVRAAILRDLGILFAVLSPVFTGKPGQLQETIPYGIRVGYGGPHKHAGGGKATIADIAMFHDQGMGHLPKRQIIAPPIGTVITQMAADMDKGLQQLANIIS